MLKTKEMISKEVFIKEVVNIMDCFVDFESDKQNIAECIWDFIDDSMKNNPPTGELNNTDETIAMFKEWQKHDYK